MRSKHRHSAARPESKPAFFFDVSNKVNRYRSRTVVPMPSIGRSCHELRIIDRAVTWRIIYRIDSDAIIIAEVSAKKTRATPKAVISNSKSRFKQYDQATK